MLTSFSRRTRILAVILLFGMVVAIALGCHVHASSHDDGHTTAPAHHHTSTDDPLPDIACLVAVLPTAGVCPILFFSWPYTPVLGVKSTSPIFRLFIPPRNPSRSSI